MHKHLHEYTHILQYIATPVTATPSANSTFMHKHSYRMYMHGQTCVRAHQLNASNLQADRRARASAQLHSIDLKADMCAQAPAAWAWQGAAFRGGSGGMI